VAAKMNKSISAVFAFFFSLTFQLALADNKDQAMTSRIQQQLKTEGRNQFDAVKDEGRKPVETSQFFGIKTGMTVLDMSAGAGYNTEILSAAVGPSGTVYAQNAHYILDLIGGELHRAMLGRLADDRLANVKYMIVDAEDMPFEESIDMAFWGFNFHDIYNKGGEAAAQLFLNAIKKALKPGGRLAISDHVGIAGKDNPKLHRVEPKIIREMLEKAGFIIEATSDLLSNPEDDHSQSVFADDIRYQTDRILVLAQKPL
jgi:predicted methyltransferase